MSKALMITDENVISGIYLIRGHQLRLRPALYSWNQLAIKMLNLEYSSDAMSTLEIKSELQKMIEREDDIHILEAIRTILQKTSLDPMLKEKLTGRALKSEKDIAEGRLLSNEEIQLRTQRR